MADPTTINRGYAIPTRGSDVGTWDVPVNGDFLLIDQNLGAVATVTLTNAPVTLIAAQYACGTIRLTGTLSADLTLTFPLVSAWWTVDNQTTGNFVVQLVCNTSGNRIGVPQGVASDVLTDGSNIAFRNLPEVGSYKDYAGTAVARWIGFCSVAPWLLCDGSTFSAVTYPILSQILGGTTLPDFRGRNNFFLNGATTRLTTAGAGLDGNTLFAAENNNGVTLAANQLPTHSSVNATQAITVIGPQGHTMPLDAIINGQPYASAAGNPPPWSGGIPTSTAQFSGNNSITVTYTNNSQVVVPLAAPGIVGGVRLIRAG